MTTVLYLYAFARPAALAEWATEGLVPGHPIRVLDFSGIAAVVSDVPTDLLPREADDLDAAGRSRLIDAALRHEHVLESALARSPILPVRFGALFTATDSLGRFVERNRAAITGFLDRVADAEEWSVKAFLHAATAREWLIAHDPELAAMRERTPASPGARYLFEKKLIAAAEGRLSTWLSAETQAVIAALAAEESRRLSASAAQEAEAGKPMPLNAVFLVRRDRLADWQETAAAHTARLAPAGLEVIIGGPWPPVHFAPELRSDGP